MIKAASEKINKLNYTVIVSIVLHLILITTLQWGHFRENVMSTSYDRDVSTVRSVTIAPHFAPEQSKDKKQQIHNPHHTIDLTQEKSQDQNEKLSQKNPIIKQKKAIDFEKERIKIQENIARKSSVLTEEKKEAKLKQKAPDTEERLEVDNLFNSLSDEKNRPHILGEQSRDFKSQAKTKSVHVNDIAISTYMKQIQNAIQNKFYYPSAFSDKTCDLHIQMAPNGSLISVKEVGGDPDLCQIAVSATQLADIPRPLNGSIYKHFKNFILVFKPQ